MAYLPDEQNSQTQNPQGPAAGGQANQAPITSSPAPTAGGSAGKTINQASSSAPAQPFTNLQAYLTANAPQIQQQGQAIAGTLNDQYGATTGAIDKAATDFKGNVAQGYTPNDAQVVNKFTADPTQVANDPNAAATFKGMLNDKYSGPGSFESAPQYGAVNDQVSKGQATAKQLSTPSGVQSYLMGQNPSETQGMATLDSSLLSGNPDAVAAVTGATKQFDNLPSYLTNASTQSNAAVQQAIQDAAAAKAAAGDAFTTTAKGFNDQIGSEFQTAQDKAKGFNTNYNDIIAKLSHSNPSGFNDMIGNLTPDEQNALKVDQGSLDRYAQANQVLSGYNTAGDLSQFVTSGIGNADVAPLSTYLSGGRTANLPQDPSGVASAQEYAKAKALSDLGGSQFTSPLDQSKVAMAGTYAPNGEYQSFDRAKADNLFNQVSVRDKAFADPYISQTPGMNPGDYTAALAAIQKGDPGQFTPGSGAAITLSALNRLANGFGAPDPGFTPVAPPGPPFLAPPTNPNPPSNGGGHHTF